VTGNRLSDADWLAAWRESGESPTAMHKATGISLAKIFKRRNTLSQRHSMALATGSTKGNDYLKRITIDGFVGTVVVSSDHHYWPGDGPSVAHKALLEVVKEVKPKLNILNGDVFDGARISRFPRNGWEEQPRVSDELEEAQERVREIEHAHLRAEKIRTLGNHCIRFDRHLATHASEMEGIAGFRLADHLRAWKECMSVMVNGHTMIKHRYHGGIHAAYNNTLRAGTNIITGHTHHLEVKPWSDYRGRRYGVQTGAIADVAGPQFSYTEDNPTPWCSGFAVLTFDSTGRLLYPELCEVIDGVAYFRGQRVAGRRKVAA
jgi:hypothetical protein